ncbi:hypothetical protein FACS1894166_06540 [Bacilli bacterium]|nr:hypothetical protein FACS1894166_06540 [Bacilli bacterium]
MFKHECASLGKLLRLRKYQKQIKAPTLLLVGKYDRTVPAKQTMRGFKRYNDKTQMYMFENSGHLIFEEETKLFVEKVINFIKQ